MIRGMLLAFAVGVLGLATYLYFHLGVREPVLVQIIDKPDAVLIYKDHVGEYYKISNVIREVESWAQAHNLDCSQSFGEYFDDPAVVEPERLRSRGGCVVSATESIDSVDLTGVKSETWLGGRFIQAEFSGSPAIAPFKVYPRLQEFAEAQFLKAEFRCIEIYRFINGKMQTTYLRRILPGGS